MLEPKRCFVINLFQHFLTIEIRMKLNENLKFFQILQIYDFMMKILQI